MTRPNHAHMYSDQGCSSVFQRNSLNQQDTEDGRHQTSATDHQTTTGWRTVTICCHHWHSLSTTEVSAVSSAGDWLTSVM